MAVLLVTCTRRTSRSLSSRPSTGFGDDPAIRAGEGDDELVISWSELRDQVHRIAGGLASLGVGKGDTVAIMLNNRPEFIPIDMAAVSLGAVPFSIYQTSSPEQIQYVVSDADAKVALVESGLPGRLQQGPQGPALDRDADRRSTARAATTRWSRSRRWTRTSTPPSRSPRSGPTTC